MNKILIGILILVFFTCIPSYSDSPKIPSSYAITVPPLTQTFEHYILDAQDKIKNALLERRELNQQTYMGGYRLEDVVNMRSPFQFPQQESEFCFQNKSNGGGKAFLLIHGLTDSPFFVKDIAHSIHQGLPCALVRGILLPGHGTVAGDALDLDYRDWLAMTEYGVHSLHKQEEIREIFLVGFSTGSALAIRHLKEGKNTAKISGLMLFSLAVSAKTSLAPLASLANMVLDWNGNFPEDDAARYASFSFEAAEEFYKLTKHIHNKKYSVELPTLVVSSADDSTVDAHKAEEFFCESVVSSEKAMVWYESLKKDSHKKRICPEKTHIVSLPSTHLPLTHKGNEYYFANYAHTSVTFSPDNFHYGAFGVYKKCKYLIHSKKKYSDCANEKGKFIFGEFKTINPKKDFAGKFDYVRAGTFNPDFDRINRAILCFSKSNCRKNNLLKVISNP